MSHFEALMLRVKAAAHEVGVTELAKRAGLEERTVRRLLKKPPRQIEGLKLLDEAAAQIMDPAEPNS